MIDQMWSQALFDRCHTWEQRFEVWYSQLPLSERPMTSIEYIQLHGSISGDSEKQQAYDQFMQAALVRYRELRQVYMRDIEPYVVKR